jgi:hypothetical protein
MQQRDAAAKARAMNKHDDNVTSGQIARGLLDVWNPSMYIPESALK